jgi:rare lipoprotein A
MPSETVRGLRLGALLLMAGCAPDDGSFSAFLARLFRPAPPPVVATSLRYVVGPGYPAGGVWYYPSESFSYEATGIAEIMPPPADGHTADGEVFDPHAMAGAHQTLQLPAIVRVTNLATGKQLMLRLNARGPSSPARVLGVTPRVAELLGFAADGTAPVLVQVESGPSQALARQLNGGANRIEVATAPRGAVQSDALPPPPGARGSAGRQALLDPAAAASDPAEPAVPSRLPETVISMPPSPVTYWIDAGSFGQPGYARTRAAQLADTGAAQRIVRNGGQTSYTVRIGPIDSVTRVDSLMQQVLRDGVSDAHVVVE